jgi:hypothetical protein
MAADAGVQRAHCSRHLARGRLGVGGGRHRRAHLDVGAGLDDPRRCGRDADAGGLLRRLETLLAVGGAVLAAPHVDEAGGGRSQPGGSCSLP